MQAECQLSNAQIYYSEYAVSYLYSFSVLDQGEIQNLIEVSALACSLAVKIN